VEFGLLGPLVVRSGGVVVPVTAGKQRVLLAALLLHANEVVGTDVLAEAVWGGRPPGTARVTLQNYVKRLRRVLGAQGYERIVTRPAGYLVAAGAGELDVTRFAELAGAGRAAARAGLWEVAAGQLSAALGLWRGQPLADVPSQVLVAVEVPRLAEMRLAAVEARIDADLHLGRHREVIAELAALAGAEPLRERLHELLMLALYRSGQQAAALAAYRQARRQLIDQVGIEPGPALRELNQQILRSDPALRLPPTTPTHLSPGTGTETASDARAETAAGPNAGMTAGPGTGTADGTNAGMTADPATGTADGTNAGMTADPATGTADGTSAGTAADAGPGTAVGLATAADAGMAADAGAETAGVAATEAGTAQDASADGERRPAMLPASVPGFAGRRPELAALSGLARPAGSGRGGAMVVIAAITGTAGVGKTALAVHWARQHTAAFPDGQLYVNLRGYDPSGDPLPPGHALYALLEALGTAPGQIPATLEGRQALYRSLLASHNILILLDNARDPAQVRPLLPATPGPVVLVTSRSDMAGLVATDGARPLALDVLTPGEARDLLTRRLGPARLDAEPDATDQLTRLTARLPLALAITAARAAARPRFPLTALAAELTDTKNRLDALSTGEDATSARAVFSWSYHSLDPPAARMFRLLGIHPGPDITPAAAASLAATDPPTAHTRLRELAQHHLLTEHAPGRYTFHDLLRTYAAEQAHTTDHPQDTHNATHRLLDHYLHTASAATRLLAADSESFNEPTTLGSPHEGVTPEPIADSGAALAWFEAEKHVLVTTAAFAADAGFDAHAWQIPEAMTDFLDRSGHWQERVGILRSALDAATRLGDIEAQALVHRRIAHSCFRLGDNRQAEPHLTESLKLYRQIGDQAGEAHLLVGAGYMRESQGDHAGALDYVRQALTLAEEIGDKARQAQALNDIGWLHAQLGDYERARSYCWQSITLHGELGNRLREGEAWDSLGYAEHHLGNYAEAASCYMRALSLLRELGHRLYQATILDHLGDVYDEAGDPGQARDAWREALNIYDGLHHSGASQIRDKLGRLSAALEATGK
jgi:DNA-binding SARP family transcriptional activator/tetratricopeptide (TPR) repeat protein